jgi:hypothetical protein
MLFREGVLSRGKAEVGDKILLPLELPGTSANRGFNASRSCDSRMYLLALFIDCASRGILRREKISDGRTEFRIGGEGEASSRRSEKFNKVAGILSRIHAEYTLRFHREIVEVRPCRMLHHARCASPTTCGGPNLRSLLLILPECILRHRNFSRLTSRSAPAPRSAFGRSSTNRLTSCYFLKCVWATRTFLRRRAQA